MRSNPKASAVARPLPRTHEGAPASRINNEQMLARSVLSCLLGEDEFYESGKLVADRIAELAIEVRPEFVAKLAMDARQKYHLRHVPLLLTAILCKTGSGSSGLVSETIERVVRRADEPGELLAIYAKRNGRDVNHVKPLSKQLKTGLRNAMRRFDDYQLAKYDRATAIRLRDVLFLVHGKPKHDGQAKDWMRLVNKDHAPEMTKAGFPVASKYALGEGEKFALPAPDTWEVNLSGGADKRETFERMIRDGKLGYFALLRNLRNMDAAGCDQDLIAEAILARKGAEQVLPFRFIAAARAAPVFEQPIDKALIAHVGGAEPLPGKTVVLVDVSQSMEGKLSGKSDMTRMDAACALASVIPGDVEPWSFSFELQRVPPRIGMAGVDAIQRSQTHGGTYLGKALDELTIKYRTKRAARLIVVTDEQSHDKVKSPDPAVWPRAYMINVASNRNGVGYGKWVHMDGFSEAVINFIREFENLREGDGET